MNFTIKKITRSEHSPLVRLILLFISMIAQGCSPFSGPVDESVSDSYYYLKSGEDICYSPMGNWFNLGKTRLNADVESFKVIGRDFGKDKDHLYFKEHIIDDEADAASFYVKDDFAYCFDKNHVYIPFDYTAYKYKEEFRQGTSLLKVEKADPDTFKKIDYRWAKDKQRYFYYFKPIDVDYNSFEILNDNFAIDKNRAYQVASEQLIVSTVIDPSTTKKLNDRYIADKDSIYDFQGYSNNGKKINKLIGLSYKNLDDFKILADTYLLVDNKVIFDGFEIDQADASSFEIVRLPYTKDSKRVFYNGEIVEQADPDTFKALEHPHYAKDKNHVFVYGKILKEADPETFGPSKEKHSLLYKDKNHTYRDGQIVDEDEK